MKAIGFFLAVFLSMLLTFLLATGEFARWFAPEREEFRVTLDVERGGTDGRGNIVTFEVWNVDLGQRSFTIWAELNQDDLQLERQVDDIRQLTLRNGTIEVPIEQDPKGAAGPAGEKASVSNVKLDFQSAVCKRIEGPGKRRGGFEILLHDGRGRANDGAEFEFEDLLFTNRPSGELETAGESFFSSNRRVAVTTASLLMVSPNGFEGVLKSRGLDSLRFLPPVTAVLDPSDSVLRREAPSPSPGAGESAAGGAVEKPAGDSGAAPTGEPSGKGKVAIRSGGGLELRFPERDRTSAGDGGARSSTVVSFRQDVVIYSVPSVAGTSIPEPSGTRFECQSLEIELEGAGPQVAPRRAVATWPGGRVRAVVLPRDRTEPYVIEGERLEWLPSPSSTARGNPLVSGGAPVDLSGEAVLHGRPTLEGPNMAFASERAVFDLQTSRVVLASVRGDLEYALPAASAAQRVQDTPPGIAPPAIDPWVDDASRGREKPSGDERPDAPRPSVRPGRTLPARWRLTADEAEFRFEDVHGQGAKDAAFSGFIARSEAPDGVVIESASQPEGPAGTGPETPSLPVRFTGKKLTYLDSDRHIVFEGAEGRRPRLTRGPDWIEANRVHAFVDKEVAWLDGEVRGSLRDLAQIWPDASAIRSPAESPGESGASAPAPAGKAGGLEIAAASLTLRRDQDTGELRDVWATGDARGPVTVTSLSAPWCRLVGPELYWDETRRIAQLRSPPPAGDAPGASPPATGTLAARVEFEDGELAADRIQFDQKLWKAHLSDRVRIRILDSKSGSPTEVLAVRTARAQVQFFPGMEARGPQGAGSFEHLSRIERIQATRSPEQPIEIDGGAFLGRAEECTWDGTTGELRFFGEGRQEIEILRDDFRGPVSAREVLLVEAQNLVVLRGDVRGQIVQSSFPTSIAGSVAPTRAEPAAAGSMDLDVPIAWNFETTELRIRLEGVPGTRRVRLLSLEARDKVFLRNDALRIQLRGDDLRYDEPSRKMHLFSRDGRPQTLICDRLGSLAAQASESPPPAASATDKAHKIGAQEIWVLLYENPHATVRAGEPGGWLLVEFAKDVIASFHVPQERSPGASRPLELGDTWKMVSEKLTLHVDPSQRLASNSGDPLRNLIPWAVASDNVVFTAGIYQATADRAIYEDALNRVTLVGSPARLTRESQPVEVSKEIFIRKVGDVLEYSPSGRQPRAPGPPPPAARP